MNIYYKSTRGGEENIKSSNAIVKGIANDGGLYVPNEFPKIDKPLEELINKDYRELSLYIMGKYLTDLDKDTLKKCIYNAYDHKFDTPEIAPLKKHKNAFILELFHGPTLAFKDMALSILPYLMKASKEEIKIDKEIVILTATSGDTGKAALEGFSNVKGTKIIVFYPKEGVSDIQERQMITQKGENTFVYGLEGNFDDAQTGVKMVFNDKELNKTLNKYNYTFSSANSINIGRLIPQIVYYVYSYLNLLKEGEIKRDEKVNFVVPTGNFGNILAAYYAKKMGLPVNKLICASNENNVLYDFINTGIYDKRRELKVTNSPSMDILVSSNLERLLYDISGQNDKLIKNMMDKLNKEGVYEITSEMKEKFDIFYGNYALEEETNDTIYRIYKEADYVIDTHTAVAYTVYEKYKKDTNDDTKTIIASTASPFKFTRSVVKAIIDDKKIKLDKFDDFKLIKKLSEIANIDIPESLNNIEKREILHSETCKVKDIKSTIEKILDL